MFQGGLCEEGCCSLITDTMAHIEVIAERVIVEVGWKDEAVMRQKHICCSSAVWQSLGVPDRLTA